MSDLFTSLRTLWAATPDLQTKIPGTKLFTAQARNKVTTATGQPAGANLDVPYAVAFIVTDADAGGTSMGYFDECEFQVSIFQDKFDVAFNMGVALRVAIRAAKVLAVSDGRCCSVRRVDGGCIAEGNGVFHAFETFRLMRQS